MANPGQDQSGRDAWKSAIAASARQQRNRRGKRPADLATVTGPGMTRRLPPGQRGYGAEHRALRKQWQQVVDAGEAYCHAVICLMSSRWIPPGTRWDLGHLPDRSGWTGPEHPRCGRSEGARRGNRMRARARRRRQW